MPIGIRAFTFTFHDSFYKLLKTVQICKIWYFIVLKHDNMEKKRFRLFSCNKQTVMMKNKSIKFDVFLFFTNAAHSFYQVNFKKH